MLRAIAFLAALPCVLGVPVVVGRVSTSPEAAAFSAAGDVALDKLGPTPPVIGVGPLVRVVELQREDAAVTARDPFRGSSLGPLSRADAVAAGAAPYAIQKYGYGEGVTRTLSLTFDDGPDPAVTPALLDVLSRNGVPATFFVTGVNASRHPELVQRMRREGHAVAGHSATHADLTEAAGWRAQGEIVLTDRVLRETLSQGAGYLRLPYESDEVGALQRSVRGIVRAQRLGYDVAGHDFDTLDWFRAVQPGGGDMPLPSLDGRNITVLMHDAGGPNRANTVRYVEEKLIPAAKAAGYSFTTMPQSQPELAARVHDVTPTLEDRIGLETVRGLFTLPNRTVRALFLYSLGAVVVVGGTNLTLATGRRLVRTRKLRHYYATVPGADGPNPPDLGSRRTGRYHPTVSVLIAAYNEEKVIARTINTLLQSRYPVLEFLVVDDGSTDATADEVARVARLDPRVRLIQQANGGKASALNNGLVQARGDIVFTVDADTIVTPEAVGYLARHFYLDEERTLGAVAGVVRVGNRSCNLLTRWQALEYVTQIGVERAAQDALGAVVIVPGACAAWRRGAILQVGGYPDATLAEDCDLSLSMHRAGWRVIQDDDAVAYTEVPEDVHSLLKQRTRWTFGTLQALYRHRQLLLRPRYGALGMLMLPWSLLSIVVPVFTIPFLTVMVVLTLRHQGLVVAGLYTALFTLVHLVIAAAGVALMRERAAHLLMVPVYRLVHEPLRAYLLYRSVYYALRGVELGWNKLQRTGQMDAVSAATVVPPQPSAREAADSVQPVFTPLQQES